ncbi:MAG: hypothetical protein ACLQPD_23150, partial [Desulfomonilaceae bacterium]
VPGGERVPDTVSLLGHTLAHPTPSPELALRIGNALLRRLAPPKRCADASHIMSRKGIHKNDLEIQTVPVYG